MKKIVQDPNGIEWVVKKHWVSRYSKFNVLNRFKWFKDENKRSLFDFSGFDFIDSFTALVVSIIVLLVFYFVIIPLLLVFLDLVVILVLFGTGIASRILFRRPWEISAKSSLGQVLEVDAVGLRGSREKFHELIYDIKTGKYAV